MIAVSAKYHQGIKELKKVIHDLIIHQEEISLSPVFINRLRHKINLEKSINGISQAIKSLQEGMSIEFVAFDLSEIVGETTAEDILDQIFTEFCIGK